MPWFSDNSQSNATSKGSSKSRSGLVFSTPGQFGSLQKQRPIPQLKPKEKRIAGEIYGSRSVVRSHSAAGRSHSADRVHRSASQIVRRADFQEPKPDFSVVRPDHSVVSSLQYFAETTTSHGPPHVLAATSAFWKFFWVLLTILMATLLGYFIKEITHVYVENEVDTTIEVMRAARLPFPAVTICNLNIVRARKSGLSHLKTFAGLNLNNAYPDPDRKDSKNPVIKRRRRKRQADNYGTTEDSTTTDGYTTDGYTTTDYTTDDTDSSDADSSDADYSDADYSDTDYSDTDYSDADSSDADYSDTDSSDADSSDADYSDTDYSDADYSDADYSDTDSSFEDGSYTTSDYEEEEPKGTTRKMTDFNPEVSTTTEEPEATTTMTPEEEEAIQQDNNVFVNWTPELDIASPTAVTEFNLQVSKTKEERRNLEAITGRTSESVRNAIGHQLCDMVLECTFNGVTCELNMFRRQPWNPNFGQCYTYNLGDLKVARVRREKMGGTLFNNLDALGKMQWSKRVGPESGLSLTLNMEPEEYSLLLGNEVGIKVVVHNQTKQPFPEDEGFVVAPGTMTYAGLRMQSIVRLGSEPELGFQRTFSDCVSEGADLPLEKNMFQETTGVLYSQTACFKTCYQNAVIKTCFCLDGSMPFLSAHAETNPVCSPGNTTEGQMSEEWRCMSEVHHRYTDMALDCDCPASCLETVYEEALSQSAWPAVNELQKCKDLGIGQAKRLAKQGTDCYFIKLTKPVALKHESYVDFGTGGERLSSLWTPWSVINSMLGTDAILRAPDVLTNFLCGIRKPNVTIEQEEMFEYKIFSKRVAKIKVYFTEFNFQAITESPSKTIIDTISDLGGVFGLCLGFSMFTFFEYMQLGMILLIRIISKIFQKKPPSAYRHR